MEKILKEILEKVNNLDAKVNNLDAKVNNLEVTVNGIKDEHGQMLRAIIESKDIQRGEIDTLTYRTVKIEGTMKGVAQQILNDLKEVSNR